MSLNVLISCLQMQATFPKYAARFEAAGIDVELPIVNQQLVEEELLAIIDRFDGVIAGDDHLSARVLEAGKRLRVVAKWGVGVDNIDLSAARHLGIEVINTPHAFDDEVADVCVGYMVLLARQLHLIDARVRSGEWFKVPGLSLNGRTLGIVGLGGIGNALARRGQAMAMRIVGTDPSDAARAAAAGLGVEVVDDPIEVFRAADVISLNCPLTPSNRHLVRAETLAVARRGVLLVNTARGGLVDESALINALRDGHVAGAALDVFEREPLAPGHPLLAFPQVILGSHNSSNSVDAVEKTSERAVNNLFAALRLA